MDSQPFPDYKFAVTERVHTYITPVTASFLLALLLLNISIIVGLSHTSLLNLNLSHEFMIIEELECKFWQE